MVMLLTGTGGLLAVIVVAGILFVFARRGSRADSRAEWGRLRERERDMASLAAFHRVSGAYDAEAGLDDRTWSDLDMDVVFAVLDRTESPLGQQALYARLRSAPNAKRVAAFERLVTRLSDDATLRERLQLALSRLACPAASNLWRLTQPSALEGAPAHILYPVAAVTMAALAAAAAFWPPALVALAAGVVVSLIVRAYLFERIHALGETVSLLSPLLAAAGLVSQISRDLSPTAVSTVSVDASRLGRASRFARWAGRNASNPPSPPVALVRRLLDVLLWLDVNALRLAAGALASRSAELLRVISAVGEFDAALSVASYRAGTPGWTRPAVQQASALLRGLRHPLLPDAVPNSINLAPPTGIVITGSNMAGKSTFLRTVGVNVVMAQTIGTCLAVHYDAPLFVVRSCIGRADDPASGKSYYLVEVEAVLSLVRAARSSKPHLMLFDELFRGTNAVERIAAGEAVLRNLLEPAGDGRPVPHTVMVATHDDELVDLLAGIYTPYHFTNGVDERGLTFDYHLEPGAATTRNAIALLARRGAPPSLIARSLARAELLDRAWLAMRNHNGSETTGEAAAIDEAGSGANADT